jgi:nucleotidyltransferase substrate binding protein (TIGR01987 family)
MELDMRWKQRFSNYVKALGQLQKFIEKGELNELEDQGLIQAFEYTFELSWNLLKDYLQYEQAVEIIHGSRDTFRIAYQRNLLEDGSVWMEMVESRIQSNHTYQESIVFEIKQKVIQKYFSCFLKLKSKMESLL